MPANKKALTRYRIIDEMLRKTPAIYPTLDRLCEEISHRIGRISPSSVEKDINAMKNDEELSGGSVAPIEHHPFYKGYYYTEPGYSFFKFPLDGADLEALSIAATTLYQFRHSAYMARFKGAIDKIRKRLELGHEDDEIPLENFIQYETAPSPGGLDHIEPLFKAIRSGNVISFNYNNVYKGVVRQHITEPYLLKEYHNRWYLIAYNEAHDGFYTLALDRISDLEITDKKFKRVDSFQPEVFFKNCIGITQFSAKPAKVILSFTPVFGKLIILQPIHSSQKVLKNSDKEVRIELNVLHTHELTALILGYRDEVKVIAPASLKKEIIENAKKIAKRYK